MNTSAFLSRLRKVCFACMLLPVVANAQSDTLVISGTFAPDSLSGAVGQDLTQVYSQNNLHGWTLTLNGVSYSYEAVEDVFWDDYVTRIHADSFDFEFVGPDADLLNASVSQQLAAGRVTDGAFVEVYTSDYYDPDFPEYSASYSTFSLELEPLDPAVGVSFYLIGDWPYYGYYYPTDEPVRAWTQQTAIVDRRPGYSGQLTSYSDLVDIGSSVPPVSLRIADGAVLEGNRGSTRLNLAVSLSYASLNVVTVDYVTVNGTAVAGSDYTATSGTLTFPPGTIRQTVSIPIKSDRKREPDETLTVRLMNSSGAPIDDAFGRGTILNDD